MRYLTPNPNQYGIRSEFHVDTPSGDGSSNTAIRYFTNTRVDIGDAMTVTNSATDGTSITINKYGLYIFVWCDQHNAGQTRLGFSVNSSQLTTDIFSIDPNDRLALLLDPTTATHASVTSMAYLSPGDIVRPHSDGNLSLTTDDSLMRGIHVPVLVGRR